MRVALLNGLCCIPSKEAESIFSMKMCEAYADEGHDVTLFISDKMDADLNEMNTEEVFNHYQVKNNFSIHRSKIYTGKLGLLWSLAISIPFRVKLKKFDIVHARNLAMAWGAAKWMNIPVIYEMHNTPDSNESQLKMFKDFCRSENCKMIITITQALADHIKQYMPSDVPVIVQPDGVSKTSLLSLGNKELLRTELGISERGKSIAVYTGHLYRGRGMELIIQLAKKLQNEYDFYIAGGREEDIVYYKDMSGEMMNVFFAGHKAQLDVLKFQQAADVLLMPYDYQVSASGGGNTAAFASPMKMFEYMASGRPMISSTLPILYEIIKPDVHAVMIPYEEVENWVSALLKLKTDFSWGNKIAENAKVEVEKYTWSSRVQSIIHSYQKIS